MIAATGVVGAAWFVVPSLQSDRQRVDAEASLHVERARRLLHQYNARLTYKSMLTDQLTGWGVDVDPEVVSEDLEDEYQRLHESIWEAYQPVDWDRERPARANYGNLARQIGAGLQRQTKFVADNERFLVQALRTVDQALAVNVGSESARTYFEANRLKATILYHHGLAMWTQALARRRDASRYRRELTGLGGNAVAAGSAVGLVEDSGLEDQIGDVESDADDIEAAIDDGRRDLDELEDRIADLEADLADAEVRRDGARREMERLKAAGADPSDRDGADRFRRAFESLGEVFREADREAHALAFGTYSNARIVHDGDLLTGRYVDESGSAAPSVEFGLVHYRDAQRVLAQRIDLQEEALEGLREAIVRLEGMKEVYRATQTVSAEQVASASTFANEIFPELNRVDSEAFTIEEDALDFLDRAAQSARAASGQARQWVSAAVAHTQDLSPEARNRSAFEQRSKLKWMVAHIAAQEADARLAKAWIHYARYRVYSQSATVLAKVAEPLRLQEADAEAERSKAQHAHDVGVAEITQAMSVLEKAHRDSGRHWTIAAQAAGTSYLMALFGHEGYVADAIEAYRSVVRGREDRSDAAKFVSRLTDLEGR